jgi:predicted AlkP superfamily pyrophosphatase or phosphodiesterase
VLASALVTFSIGAVLGACTPAAPQIASHAVHAPAAVPAPVRPAPPGAVTDHVVIVSIDGLRPDAIARFDAATIGRLMRDGGHSLAARTILPSRTLPSHTSMLTGEEPGDHGITWNSNETDSHATVAVPTIFGVAHQHGLRTAAFFAKGKFNHLEVPGTLDYSQAPDGDDRWSVDRTIRDVERHLAEARPNLMFVHIGEPDYSGHKRGWMSESYGGAVRKADAAVARIVAAATHAFGDGNYTLIITADHGGHGRTHGSDSAEDVTIPWIVWGEGVRPGAVLSDGIRTMDTAGTALWLLGIPVSAEWTGVPVREAFTLTSPQA